MNDVTDVFEDHVIAFMTAIDRQLLSFDDGEQMEVYLPLTSNYQIKNRALKERLVSDLLAKGWTAAEFGEDSKEIMLSRRPPRVQVDAPRAPSPYEDTDAKRAWADFQTRFLAYAAERLKELDRGQDEITFPLPLDLRTDSVEIQHQLSVHFYQENWTRVEFCRGNTSLRLYRRYVTKH